MGVGYDISCSPPTPPNGTPPHIRTHTLLRAKRQPPDSFNGRCRHTNLLKRGGGVSVPPPPYAPPPPSPAVRGTDQKTRTSAYTGSPHRHTRRAIGVRQGNWISVGIRPVPKATR